MLWISHPFQRGNCALLGKSHTAQLKCAKKNMYGHLNKKRKSNVIYIHTSWRCINQEIWLRWLTCKRGLCITFCSRRSTWDCRFKGIFKPTWQLQGANITQEFSHFCLDILPLCVYISHLSLLGWSWYYFWPGRPPWGEVCRNHIYIQEWPPHTPTVNLKTYQGMWNTNLLSRLRLNL